VSNFIEIVSRLDSKDLSEHINEYMSERMFLVSTNITAADIVVFSALANYFAKELKDYEKIALPNVFRWLDHIQHLPGLLQ
jgi:glutathione S-transferase